MKPLDDPPPQPAQEPPRRLDAAVVAALFVEHGEELRRFLWGVLRHHEQVQDVLQLTFTKAIEHGHGVREESLKAWLFRVALNEAIVVKRRQAIDQRALGELTARGQGQPILPDLDLVRWETVTRIRDALQALPEEQREVVRLRIHEQLKFAEIAEALNLPLGTVLTRMQLALKKLKKALDDRSSR